jgi:transposase
LPRPWHQARAERGVGFGRPFPTDATIHPLGIAHAATTTVLRSLARRVLALTDETRALQKRMSSSIAACTPQLLDQHGVGPDTGAALLITAGDNPDRLTSQAAFAALCGVNPIEASSGKTTRHRLNRGGDRRANSALYTIVLTRLGRDRRTRTYATKRASEGKSTMETVRCLKRYVARELFPLITAALPPAPTLPPST